MNSEPFDVLVTGAAGHLGAALMLELPSLGYRPLGIDILPSETTSVQGSISDRDFVASLVKANPGIRHVVHTATLHKPHVDSHSVQDFIDTNVTGTQVLLEAAATLTALESFLFISTTSTFGAALSPSPGSPAAWINESVTPIPKNIYGITKCAAEDLCFLAYKKQRLPVLVLRTSRFFPEQDDDEQRRAALDDSNLKVLELVYRRVDVADVVSACVAGMKNARRIGWSKFIISAPTPFQNDAETLEVLNRDAKSVFERVVPQSVQVFEQRLDRVYDSGKAVKELGWKPVYTFERALEQIAKGQEWRSELTLRVGKKGYHTVSTGVYTQR
ncbi:NAD dependent epimerase/dehydratase family protein [Rhizoclosmatium globosum]|uniref:NAD dependent epimerase/dehydratase family protein n=1 Tax=Rhizoclosmatium globosum TaxID=329046 RepID=A0A1Y2BXD3_9FUNG|nr:NAD dependent epimerase/dehydratase family protein [Rhizoclosmatium globosum]|eukprot:ORY39432.1 NAD dependent epimerase/dehydratase family protein [Rhizoclosmatium globosum]